MVSLPVLKSKEVLKALLRAGFYIHHQTGSHARLFHRSRKNLKVTVTVHSRDMPVDTLKRILKQAGIEKDALMKLL